jgi:hypothetical protein
MHLTENIDYFMAQSFFNDAELKGYKLTPGHFNTNIWVHNEKVNLDEVIKAAKKFTDSRIFIIAEGLHKGFYIYSILEKACIKLIRNSETVKAQQIA